MWHETGHRAEVTCIARSPQANVFAVGYADGSIRLWNSTDGSVIATFNGHKKSVSILAFDDQGTRLASGSQDTDLILWDVTAEAGLFRSAHRIWSLPSLIPLQTSRTSRSNNGHPLSEALRKIPLHVQCFSRWIPSHCFKRYIHESLGSVYSALYPDCRRSSLRCVGHGCGSPARITVHW